MAKALSNKPLADITETNTAFIARIWLPGVEEKDIVIQPSNGGLEVSVQRETQVETEEAGAYHFTSAYTGIYRRIALPADADVRRMRTRFRDSILTILIPKGKR